MGHNWPIQNWANTHYMAGTDQLHTVCFKNRGILNSRVIFIIKTLLIWLFISYEYACVKWWHRLQFVIFNNTRFNSWFQISFILELNGQFDFSKCRGLSIRGFNKMKLYSTVYSHIRDCEAFNPVLIIPKTVIDAVGTPDPDRG